MLTAHAFLIFRLSVSLLQAGFADPKKSYRLFEMNTSWFDALKRFDSVINDNPVFSIIAPVLVWLVVVIGMEMWPAVRQKISGGFRLSRTNRDFGTADRQSFRDFERAGRHSSRGRKS